MPDDQSKSRISCTSWIVVPRARRYPYLLVRRAKRANRSNARWRRVAIPQSSSTHRRAGISCLLITCTAQASTTAWGRSTLCYDDSKHKGRGSLHFEVARRSDVEHEYEFTIVLERDEDGAVIATVPALPGCHTAGDTESEALALIQDAIRLHIEARL